jgi:hypothetical protein
VHACIKHGCRCSDDVPFTSDTFFFFQSPPAVLATHETIFCVGCRVLADFKEVESWSLCFVS